MLCQEKAEKLSIRTARLPIGTYLEDLPTRKVLTVNQVCLPSCMSSKSYTHIYRKVFAILVQYIALNDWSKAFEAVIPRRKYQQGKSSKRSKQSMAEADDEVEERTIDENKVDGYDEGGLVSEEALMNT